MDSRSPDADRTSEQRDTDAADAQSTGGSAHDTAPHADTADATGDSRGARDDQQPDDMTDPAPRTQVPDVEENASRGSGDSTDPESNQRDDAHSTPLPTPLTGTGSAPLASQHVDSSSALRIDSPPSPHTSSTTAPSPTATTESDARASSRRDPHATSTSASAPTENTKPAARTGSRRVPRWAFLPFIAVSAAHVVALALHADAIAAPTKLALMPLLAFAVLVGARGLRATAPVVLLLTAILFSWLGDGAGTFVPFLPTLPMMLAFFGVAHLAYIALFWRHLRVRKFPLAAGLLVLWWAGMVIVIAPAAKELAIAVAAYGIILGLTAAFATRCAPTVLVGALFFLASDTILAFMLFLPQLTPPITDAAVMLTYTLGQGLIAAGALAHLRRRQSEAA